MPSKDGVGTHQQPEAGQAGSGELVKQCGQPCTVGGFEPNPLPVELAVQDGELVAQGEDFRVLVAVGAW
ncbi:hypothetical protein [Actinoplanes sp. NPDC049599]|uniref:hypothetical protein n=1 Tax=Actinoplanes sp. NPDC049599 TaxID=3363903 RepID=UPI0037AFD2D7